LRLKGGAGGVEMGRAVRKGRKGRRGKRRREES